MTTQTRDIQEILDAIKYGYENEISWRDLENSKILQIVNEQSKSTLYKEWQLLNLYFMGNCIRGYDSILSKQEQEQVKQIIAKYSN